MAAVTFSERAEQAVVRVQIRSSTVVVVADSGVVLLSGW